MMENIVRVQESCDSAIENIVRECFFNKITGSDSIRPHSTNKLITISDGLKAIFTTIHTGINGFIA